MADRVRRVGLAVPFRSTGGVTQIIDGIVDGRGAVDADVVVLVPPGGGLFEDAVAVEISPLPRPGRGEIVPYVLQFPRRQVRLARQLHDLDLDLVVGFGLNGGDVFPAAFLARIPRVLSLNSDRGAGVGPYLRLLARSASAVLTEGPGVQRRLLGDVAFRKVVHFLPPVDIATIVGPSGPPAPRGLDSGAEGLVLGMLSNITSQKDHHCALEVVASLRKRGLDVRLRIGGRVTPGDPYGSSVREHARTPELRDAVTFTGWTDPRSFISEIDAALVTSRYEGVATSTLEAMACSRPFLSLPVGSLPELAAVSGAGWCSPPGGGEGRVQRLVELIEARMGDRSELVDAGRRGQQFVATTCTWREFGRRFNRALAFAEVVA